MITLCAKCGKEHPGCTGHRSKDKQPCDVKRGLIITRDGHRVCATHGGRTPHVKAAADRRITQEKAKASISVLLAETMGETSPDVDPMEELLRVIYVTAVAERWLRAEVEEPFVATMFGLAEHPLWSLWQKERVLLAKFAKAAMDANVDERQVRVQEQQAEIIVAVLRRIFDDPRLGLSEQQRVTVITVAGDHLRRLDAA